MECKEIELLMSRYLENELDNITNNQVKNHIQSCARCQTIKENIEFLISNLPYLEEDIPFLLKNRLWKILEIGEESKKRFRYIIFQKWAAAFIGTVVLLFNLFYFTDIYPAANRQMHFLVSHVGKLISYTEVWIEKVKESKNILFFSLFKKQQTKIDSDKSNIDRGGKNG